MGHENHSQLGLGPDIEQLLLQYFACQCIQRAKRFIHQQHFAVVGKSACNRDTLLHATRQLIRKMLRKLTQAHHVEEVIRNLFELGLRQAALLGAESDVLAHRQPGEQAVVLKHHAAVWAWFLNGGVVHARHTGRDWFKPTHDAQQGGFSAARGSDQADKFTFLNLQVDVLERMDGATVEAEHFADIHDVQNGSRFAMSEDFRHCVAGSI